MISGKLQFPFNDNKKTKVKASSTKTYGQGRSGLFPNIYCIIALSKRLWRSRNENPNGGKKEKDICQHKFY